MQRLAIRSTDGVSFTDGPDHGRVLVFGRETGGAYGLMEFCVAPGATAASPFGAHLHREMEETFLVRSGRLEFLLGDEVLSLGPRDFVRAPPGLRHGYRNVSGVPVELLVSFHPGGFEELFVRHQEGDGFLDEATRLHASVFEET